MKIDALSSGLSLKPEITVSPETKPQKDFEQVLNQVMQSKDDKKLYQACQELEAVFLNQVLSSMRSTVWHSDLIDRGFATETFESMLYEEYAKEISKTESIGLARIIYEQLRPK